MAFGVESAQALLTSRPGGTRISRPPSIAGTSAHSILTGGIESAGPKAQQMYRMMKQVDTSVKKPTGHQPIGAFLGTGGNWVDPLNIGSKAGSWKDPLNIHSWI